ncbi:hypothetical protein FH972_025551 [Carpinus fangiana]|uniref:TauD/TfdA-like domain-containing protein n=1 Tax=Carpinus fangiana TaxID=176857 RepID=A0A5N6L1B9_9ROSI|nr:hypothetical protein FH972_025551 [Carpinus fangiana]
MDTPPLASLTPAMGLDIKVLEPNVAEVDPITPPLNATIDGESVSDINVGASSSKANSADGLQEDAEGETTVDSGAHPPKPLTAEQKADHILNIFERYRMNTAAGRYHPWKGRANVRSQILHSINNEEKIRMILPAFPFKSPNKTSKVLGALPDAAEEIAIKHMQGLCTMVTEVYTGGANLHIVSDGLCYNEVWRYGQALRNLALTQECYDIKFVRLVDILGEERDEPLTQDSYLANASSYRQTLLDKYSPAGFDPDVFIKQDADALLTYRGYIKFLEKDLEHAPHLSTLSKTQRAKHHENTAKHMIIRGKAFAEAIKTRFSDYVRLSIHASTADASKLSISLLPQQGPHNMTPWHSSLVRALDGSISMAHASSVPALTHDIIHDASGRRSYFREKSELYNWPGMDVSFEYLYPTGIVIRPKSTQANYSLHNVHMQKVRALAEVCSPVILRGFSDTTDERTFQAKAYDAGTVLPWTFGIMQKVRDSGRTDREANNVVSAEAMPMHYDGMFKFLPASNPDGSPKLDKEGNIVKESSPPRFQLFTALTTAPKKSGYTLFASSRLFFRHLPPQYSLEEVEGLTWDCINSGFWDCHMQQLPLVVRHPVSGEPCVRWHEPWPMWKTKFAHALVNIENPEQGKKGRSGIEYVKLVDSMLYDRRVCLYFEWDKGDVVCSDNTNMLHTRSAFDGSCDRELWRIHFD